MVKVRIPMIAIDCTTLEMSQEEFEALKKRGYLLTPEQTEKVLMDMDYVPHWMVDEDVEFEIEE